MLVQTHKAISQLHKEIRHLQEGIVSVEVLIVEKQKTIESLQLLLNKEQLKVIDDVIIDTDAGAEDAIYNNIPDEEIDVGMAGVSYWNMIDALSKNVAIIINNPNATAESVLQHVEHIKQQVENIKAEFEDKYMK